MNDFSLKLKRQEIVFPRRLSKKIRNDILIRSKEEAKFFDEDNNYIDYFIEIGVKPEIFKKEFLYNTSSLNDINKNLKPVIISKFPESNKKSIIINNIIINQIFPHGFNAIEAKNKPDPYFFAIMSDNQLYSIVYKYKYLSCLIIYESISEYKKLYNKYFNKDNNENIDNNNENIYIPKCLCIASVHPCIDKFEEILRTIYQMTMSNKYSNLFVNQLIEELVIRTPKIPLGFKKVILKVNEKQINLTEKKINDYPLIHVDLPNLFGLLSFEQIIGIFKFILLDGSLIFFSKKLFELTNSIMSILSLLSPFKYQYQIISVLSKEFYFYLESDLPFIFGINQTYHKTFFEENKICLNKKIVCIVNLDEKNIEFIPQKYSTKDNPDLPKHLKDRIEKQIQDYYKQLISSANKGLEKKESKSQIKNEKYKNNDSDDKIEESNEQYQIIFYKFMVELLEDYPKYLKKNVKITNINEVNINDLIDTNLYLNTFNLADKEFYKKIFKTKMFKEFILKRVDPKYNIEKIEAIFFEEKINERIAEKKMFGKAKIIEQNKLLSSKDYDYSPNPEIIDLSNQKLSSSVIELFKDKSFIKDNCLINGYIIEENNNDFVFSYYIFPSLFDSKFFLLNVNNYNSAPILYKHVDVINSQIVKKTTIKFNKKPITKKYNLENDLYICYIILWSLTFWYTDEKEKDYRFKKMLFVLNKINQQKLEVYQLLFENMNKYQASEDEIFLIYVKFLQQKLNSNWIIFNLIFPILQNKEMDLKSNPTGQFLKLGKTNLKTFQTKISENKEAYLKRTLKSPTEYEDNIISDDVRYDCYTKCFGCGRVFDFGKLCANLSLMQLRNQNGIDQVKCTYKNKEGKSCDYYNFLKLKFRYGSELFNQKVTKYSTSKNFNIPLLSTTTLKEKLFDISKSYKDFDQKINIDLFKKDHKLEFWNSIWYFELNGLDISFILPYSHVQNINLADLRNNISTKYVEGHKVNIINDNKSLEIERSNYKCKYFSNDLCEQTLYQFAFINKIGMVSYKNIYIWEDNINYNEYPLIFENVEFNQDNEIENDDPSLVRCLTSNSLNGNNSYNDINTSFGNSTPITKKYTSYINFLRSEKKTSTTTTLINSSSSPMLLNTVNTLPNNRSSKRFNNNE